MRKPIVIGNWKMNGTLQSSRELLQEIRNRVDRDEPQGDIGVCVPYIFIPFASQMLEGSRVLLGAQNVGDKASGAFTGEISAGMLKEYGCRLAIVGHSERRLLYGESDALVAQRLQQALDAGITPVLCVGETLDQREHGQAFDSIAVQLDAVLEIAGIDALKKSIVAYEPVWAIGTGKTASSGQAQEIHAFIRDKIRRIDKSIANQVQILYGGSVKPDNSSELFSMPDIDGGLIGGASLDAESFLTICYSV